MKFYGMIVFIQLLHPSFSRMPKSKEVLSSSSGSGSGSDSNSEAETKVNVTLFLNLVFMVLMSILLSEG